MHHGDYRARWNGGKKHDRSGVVKNRYAALCLGCEGRERNGRKPLRSLCCAVKSKVGGCMD